MPGKPTHPAAIVTEPVSLARRRDTPARGRVAPTRSGPAIADTTPTAGLVVVVLIHNRTEHLPCATLAEAIAHCLTALDTPGVWPVAIRHHGRILWAAGTAYDTRRTLHQFRLRHRESGAGSPQP